MDCHRPQIFSAPALRMGRRGGRVLGTACSLCQRPSRSRDGMRRVLAPPSRRRRAGGGRPSPRIWTRPHAPSGRVSGRHFVNRPCSAGGPLEPQHQVCGNPTSATFRMFGAGTISRDFAARPRLRPHTQSPAESEPAMMHKSSWNKGSLVRMNARGSSEPYPPVRVPVLTTSVTMMHTLDSYRLSTIVAHAVLSRALCLAARADRHAERWTTGSCKLRATM